MYCVNCGKEIADTDKVCRFCGESVNNFVVSQEETPVENAVDTVDVDKVSDESIVDNNEAEVVEVNEIEMVDTVELTGEGLEPVKKKISKKKKFTILGICAALVVAAVVGAVLFWDYVENTAVNTFSSSDTYYHYVEGKNVDEIAESMGAAIGNLNKIFAENAANGKKSEISIKLGDVLLDSLAKNLGVEKSEISWASDIDLSSVSSVKDGVSAGKTELSLNNKPILNIELVFKMENMSYFLRMPELNKEYMLFKLPSNNGTDVDNATLMKIYKALPDEETTTDIISRYLTVAIENIENVERDRVTVEANFVEQSCVELAAYIDEETVADIVEALLKEFRSDKEIKKVIEKIYQAVEPVSAKKFDMEYNDWMEKVDEAIDDIEEYEDSLGKLDFTIITWVDSKGETIGREIVSLNYDGQFRYLSTHNGTEVGIEACFLDDNGKGYEFLGYGTIKQSKMSGNVELFEVNTKRDKKDLVANISIKDYDVDLIEDNYINGVFTITLSNDICKELANDLQLPVTAINYLKKSAIELSITSSKDKASVKLRVLYDSDTVITISVTTTENEVVDITVPENGIKINDSGDLIDYIEDMKFDTFKNNLKAAGVPSDLVDAIFSIFAGGNVQQSQSDFSYDGGFSYDSDTII